MATTGTAPLGTAPASVAISDLAVIGGTITFTGMGDAQLGMSVVELAYVFDVSMKFHPLRACPWISSDVVGFEIGADRGGHATSFVAYLPDGDQVEGSAQVRGVFSPTTPEGIGLGSSRVDVVAAYGTRVEPRRRVEPESTPSGLDPEDLVVRSGPGDDDYVISFDIREGAVRSIGVEPFWKTYGEPCL